MNKQYLRKTLPVMAAVGVLSAATYANNAFKEKEAVGPEPAIRTVEKSRARRIVKCGSDFDAEGLDAVVFVIGLFIAGAAMSLGR